jgi:hypothetical protein
MSRRDATRDWLERLHAAAADPTAPSAAETIRAALQRREGPVVDKAARVVAEHALVGFEAALVAAWAPLFVQPVKRDPGCGAKLAIATALDRLDHLHPDLFLQGAAWRQPEPSWGAPVDTATALRARCGHALVRMAWPDALATLADLLADPEARVREEAARALGHHGGSGAAALVRYALRRCLAPASREDPAVVEALLAALLACDRAAGGELAAGLVRDDGPWARSALLALADTRDDAVVPLLADALDRSVGPDDQQAALTALAIHRTHASRQVLLAAIAEGPLGRARLAVSALTVQASDPRLVAEVRAAAALRHDPRLDLQVDAVFGAET